MEIEIDLKGRGGIYEIRHIATNMAYCGRTANLGLRRDHHFGRLSRGKHTNHKLQTDYDKSNVGNSAFEFRVLEYCDDPEQRVEKEQRLLDSGNFSYNIRHQASGGTGRTSGNRHVVTTYKTPWGVFSTVYEASLAGFMSGTTIGKCCQYADERITLSSYKHGRYLRENYDETVIGKKWSDIGFGYDRQHILI
ncbi:GIY-YIG nuclease family protein [Sinorhizobium meliloti]|uniref:GIY-YIG nuclease family protein n=1 Tax=Rhizobium meliloti TaxID=382 RepID=UPI0014303FEE|nr:GIY-YIG nuclease family protein [Sinorhizobium meliloti]